MFYEWVYPLHEIPGLSALNVFRYITFRTAYAAITALLTCFVLGPPMIGWLRRVRFGQKVREEGPQSHLQKAGTPTMGGILIVTAIVIPTLLWGNFHSRPVWLALLATVWLGALGFLDDYLRVVMLTLMAWAWARIDATPRSDADAARWSQPAAAFRRHVLPEFDMRLGMVKRACEAVTAAAPAPAATLR